MKQFFSHWKTSAMGLAFGILSYAANHNNKYQALAIAALGLFSKDFNK